MKAEIQAKLEKLEEYTRLLKKYQAHDLEGLKEDPTLRGATERYFETALECILDIGGMIISMEGLRKPDKYREIIEILGDEGILSREFVERFAPAAGFRNILVHMYAEVDVEKLYEHLQKDLKDFDVFARQVAKYLKEK
ncbi:MAG: DUF86 domain-containing protein [Candidatus Hadarchaeota archaeon]|nr:DUF86 domain-containing protein [Candidatus Hadarchaeota archaeon]